MTLPDDIKELIERDLPKKPLGELLQDLQRDLPDALDIFLASDSPERRQWLNDKISTEVKTDVNDYDDRDVSDLDPEGVSELPELHWLTDILRFKPASSEEHEFWAKQIEAGVFAQEKLESLGENLDINAAQNLNKIVNIGKSSNNLFMLHNLRLVWSIARKSPKLLSTEEHFQNGIIGLIRGIQGWDWRQGYQFSTYASWWIRQSIWRAMADTAHTIRLPVHMIEKINSEAKELITSASDDPEHDGDEIKSDEENDTISMKNSFLDPLVLAKNAIHRNYSYEMIVEKYDFLLEYEVDPYEDTTFDCALQSVFVNYLNLILGTISSKEEIVIRNRYGLDDGEPKTLEEIGVIFGVTRERIRQIETKVMNKLRHPSRSESLKDYLGANLSRE
jgi:RNA polymerase primary sigma factor